MTPKEQVLCGMADDSPRERLLEVASDLMGARGYEAVGVAELCSAAEVKKGSFYYFFDSKQALTLEMLDVSWQSVRDRLFKTTFGNLSIGPLQAIRIYGEALSATAEQYLGKTGTVGGCMFGNFAVELSTRDDQIRQRIADVLAAMVGDVEESLERGIASGELPASLDANAGATDVITHMQGLMVLAKATRDPAPLATLGSTAARLLR